MKDSNPSFEGLERVPSTVLVDLLALSKPTESSRFGPLPMLVITLASLDSGGLTPIDERFEEATTLREEPSPESHLEGLR
jgi:hypothetical protein